MHKFSSILPGSPEFALLFEEEEGYMYIYEPRDRNKWTEKPSGSVLYHKTPGVRELNHEILCLSNQVSHFAWKSLKMWLQLAVFLL